MMSTSANRPVIPPILSSSPPPLDDCGISEIIHDDEVIKGQPNSVDFVNGHTEEEEEEEEQFGNFCVSGDSWRVNFDNVKCKATACEVDTRTFEFGNNPEDQGNIETLKKTINGVEDTHVEDFCTVNDDVNSTTNDLVSSMGKEETIGDEISSSSSGHHVHLQFTANDVIEKAYQGKVSKELSVEPTLTGHELDHMVNDSSAEAPSEKIVIESVLEKVTTEPGLNEAGSGSEEAFGSLEPVAGEPSSAQSSDDVGSESETLHRCTGAATDVHIESTTEETYPNNSCHNELYISSVCESTKLSSTNSTYDCENTPSDSEFNTDYGNDRTAKCSFSSTLNKLPIDNKEKDSHASDDVDFGNWTDAVSISSMGHVADITCELPGATRMGINKDVEPSQIHSGEAVTAMSKFAQFDDDDDDDEFGDFTESTAPQAPQVSTDRDEKVIHKMENNEGIINVEGENEDDEFADFEAAGTPSDTFSNVENIPQPPRIESSMESILDSESRMFEQLATCFTSASDYDRTTNSLFTITECLQGKNSKFVWNNVRDVEETHALSYIFTNSECDKQMLKVLNVDARNILKANLPIFAVDLAHPLLLQPLKQQQQPATNPQHAVIPTLYPSGTAVGGVESPDDKSCSSGSNCSGGSGGTSGTAPTPEIPPAQFDWSSSGLTNPIEGLDPELVKFDSTLSPTSEEDASRSLSEIERKSKTLSDSLSRLLSSSVSTTPAATCAAVGGADKSTDGTSADSGISAESQQVLATLPDLSYMTAKVLMFPVTQQ